MAELETVVWNGIAISVEKQDVGASDNGGIPTGFPPLSFTLDESVSDATEGGCAAGKP